MKKAEIVHNSQYTLLSAYRNKIVLNKLTIDDVLAMLENDLQFLEGENAVLNVESLLNTEQTAHECDATPAQSISEPLANNHLTGEEAAT
jgi:hypothetical protein